MVYYAYVSRPTVLMVSSFRELFSAPSNTLMRTMHTDVITVDEQMDQRPRVTPAEHDHRHSGGGRASG
jgi:hypothetical protein